MRDVGEGSEGWSCRPSRGLGVPTRKVEPATRTQRSGEALGRRRLGTGRAAPRGPRRSGSRSRTRAPGGAPGRRDIGELQKGKSPRAVPGGNSGFAGRGNVTCRVCLPPARRVVRRERENARCGGLGCLQTGGAGRIPSPAEHQETQDHQQQESERAAGPPRGTPRGHRAFAPRAGTRFPLQPALDARPGSARGAGPLAGRLGNRAAAQGHAPLPRAAALGVAGGGASAGLRGRDSQLRWGASLALACLPSPVSERCSKFRKLFYMHLICKHMEE